MILIPFCFLFFYKSYLLLLAVACTDSIDEFDKLYCFL